MLVDLLLCWCMHHDFAIERVDVACVFTLLLFVYYQGMASFKRTVEEVLDQDPDARLSASCVQERMCEMLRNDRLGGDGNNFNPSLSNST